MEEKSSSKKRVRDESADSVGDLSDVKRVRDDSDESVVGHRDRKRIGDDSVESELDLPEVKKLGEDLLCSLDDPDLCTAAQDLDSFMKSFEDEISASSPPPKPEPASESVQLGYLFEASDDELGLPPSISTSPNEAENSEQAELVRASSETSEITELWRFDEHISGYDSFELGIAGSDSYYNNNNFNNSDGEYVALDGLFDYSDFSWRLESLPAQ